MVKSVCTLPTSVKEGKKEPSGIYAQHKQYYDAMEAGAPLEGYWHGFELKYQGGRYGVPVCGHLFFASHTARVKHFEQCHKKVLCPAADEHVYKVGFAAKITRCNPTPWGRMVPLR